MAHAMARDISLIQAIVFLETSLGTANHSVEEQLTRNKALRESLVQAYLLFPVPNSGWQRHFLITNPNLHLGREAPP